MAITTKSDQDILSYFMKVNKSFIHPKEKIASDFLLKRLEPKGGDKILELGFGTGGSLVRIFSRNNDIELFGVEINESMINRCDLRLKFCGIREHVTLKKLNSDDTIPFTDNYFDKIYIESVLGIQDGESLKNMIVEIGRVLKPDGILCINELIWKSHVKQDEIDAINEFGKKRFGIIQANGVYKCLQDWQNLLQQQKFVIQQADNITGLKNRRIVFPKNWQELLSDIFSLTGKVKAIFTPRLRTEWKSFEKDMETFKGVNNLEPYIITASSKK